MKRRWLIPAALCSSLLCGGLPARAESIGGNNLTLFLPQVKTLEGDRDFGAPLSDYLTVNANDFLSGWLSFHASGYERVRFGDAFDDTVDRTELTYGYLDVRNPGREFNMRLGRQFIYMGVAREQADSVKIDLQGLGGLKLSAFAGLPIINDYGRTDGVVILPDEDHRGGYPVRARPRRGSGDSIVGGRLSYGLTLDGQLLAEVGFSGIHSAIDSDPDRDNIGVDFFGSLPGASWANLSGHVFYDLLYGDLFEINVIPTVSIGDLTLSFRYNRTEPSASISKYSILSVFSDDIVEEIGGTADLQLGYGLAVDATFESFNYGSGSNGYEAEGNLRAYHGEKDQNVVGVGVNWMDAGASWIDADEAGSNGDAKASYVGVRGFGRQYVYEQSVFLDGEIFGYFFDKKVEDKSTSVTGSIDIGFSPMERLEVLAGLAYERNPLFDEVIWGTVRLTYTYFGMIGR